MSNVLNSLKSRVHKQLKSTGDIPAPLAEELLSYIEKLENRISVAPTAKCLEDFKQMYQVAVPVVETVVPEEFWRENEIDG